MSEHDTMPPEYATDASRATARAGEDLRVGVAVQIEWTLLVLRYLAYGGLLGAHAVGEISAYTPDLFFITIGALLQNAYVHIVLYIRRYELFLTPLNFFIHLAKICLIVGLTGVEASPSAPLYMVLIMGYCLVSRDFRSVYRVALVCATAYAATLLVAWTVQGIDFTYPVGSHFFNMFLCAFFMSKLGQMLVTTETEAERRAHELLTSETTLRAILDTTPSPILVTREDEIITEANDGACSFLCVERESLIGQRIRAFIFDDGTLPNRIRNLRGRGKYRGEVVVLPRDREERTVDLLVRSFMRDGQRYYVSMLHDITEQKDIQEATRLANQRLEQLNFELQQMNELRTEFFTKVARRLRSPLSAVLGYADLLLNDELGELNLRQRDALQSSRKTVRRMFGVLDEAQEAEATSLPLVRPAAQAQVESGLDSETGPDEQATSHSS